MEINETNSAFSPSLPPSLATLTSIPATERCARLIQSNSLLRRPFPGHDTHNPMAVPLLSSSSPLRGEITPLNRACLPPSLSSDANVSLLPPMWSQQAWAILWDEVMLLTGMLALITAGWQRALWTGVTHVAMLPVLPYISKGFQE